jgi:hypothetical protein
LFNVVAAKTQDTIYSFEGGTLQYLEKSRRHSISDLSAGLLESSLSKYTSSRPDDSIHGDIEEPTRPEGLPSTAQWLGGLGEGAWFDISDVAGNEFTGRKYDKTGALEHEARYSNEQIDVPEIPIVTYASHYGFISLRTGDVVHRFYRK